jgi:hypothetical protein
VKVTRIDRGPPAALVYSFSPLVTKLLHCVSGVNVRGTLKTARSRIILLMLESHRVVGGNSSSVIVAKTINICLQTFVIELLPVPVQSGLK